DSGPSCNVSQLLPVRPIFRGYRLLAAAAVELSPFSHRGTNTLPVLLNQAALVRPVHLRKVVKRMPLGAIGVRGVRWRRVDLCGAKKEEADRLPAVASVTEPL